MKSNVLSYFGMNLDIFVTLISLVCIGMLIAYFFLIYDYMRMRKKYVEFMTGEEGKNLEYTIYKRFREIDDLKVGQKDNDEQVAIIFDKVRKGYCKTGIYKYNAFTRNQSDESEKTSFAITLLDDTNNGFVLNAIHSRAGSHIYLKKILRGNPDSVLSEEEKESLKMALGTGHKHDI